MYNTAVVISQSIKFNKFIYLPLLESFYNIGTIGSVAHGKTTFTKNISTYSIKKLNSEKKRKLSIRLSYAKTFVFNPKKKSTFNKSTKLSFNSTIHSFSIIDCPGHKLLISTLINGISIMEGTILIIGVHDILNFESIIEHLSITYAKSIMIKACITTMIDLVKLKTYLYNILLLIDLFYLIEKSNKVIFNFSQFSRENLEKFKLHITNLGFSINNLSLVKLKAIIIRKYTNFFIESIPNKYQFMILACAVTDGVISKNQLIEILPFNYNLANKAYSPIIGSVRNIRESNIELNCAIKGAIITISIKLNKTDKVLITNTNGILGSIGTLPSVYYKLKIKIKKYYENFKFQFNNNLKKNDKTWLIQSNSNVSTFLFEKIKKNKIFISLATPICIEQYNKIIISHIINGKWKIIGWGYLYGGKKLKREII